MPRPCMFDSVSSNSNSGKEAMNKKATAKENWIRANRNEIWQQALVPIRGRIKDICQDKTELLRKLMDSKDEYFRFCKAKSPTTNKPQSGLFVVRLGPSPSVRNEYIQDPTALTPMRTPPSELSNTRGNCRKM